MPLRILAGLLCGLGLFTATGCDESDPITTDNLAFLGASGNLVLVEGVWEVCYQSGGIDYESERVTVEGLQFTVTNQDGHAQPDCSDVPAGGADSFTVTITVTGERESTWAGGTPAGLDDIVLTSTFTYDGDEAGQGVGFIDDLMEPLVLYLGTNMPVDSDGYPEQLANAALVRQ